VPGGADVAAELTSFLRAARNGGNHGTGDVASHPAYAAVVGTLDWHIDPGPHFSDHPDFVDTWPAHCRVGSDGSHSHPDLDQSLIAAWFHKGEHQAAYSGFEGHTSADDGSLTGLADWLRRREIDAVDVAGIATDHCVRATALDAVKAGFRTRVLLDLTVGVAVPTTIAALEQLRTAGAELVGVLRSPRLDR